MQFFEFKGYPFLKHSTFLFDYKARYFESSFPSSIGSFDSSLSPTSLFLSLDSSFSSNSNVSKDSISSSGLIIFKSFASLIVVALYANQGGKDLKAFFTSFYLGIFSPRENNSLAMSHNFSLKSLIVSFSLIHKFLNFVVSSSNLDSRTPLVPSKWTQRMSHASLAISVLEIILHCEGSTLLKIAFRACEFWVEWEYSSSVQSEKNIETVFPSESILVGDFHPYRSDLHSFSSIDLM